MSLLTLTPARLVAGGGSPTNLTSLFQSLGANTGVVWDNTGHEALFILVGTTPTTLTSDIPIIIQGEPVQGQTSGALPVSTTQIVGPYPSQFDDVPTGEVEIDFSSATGISVALIQMPGVD
jgi:hypothetical protein